MTFAAGPRAAQAGYRVSCHERLDSTNSEAMRLVRSGERGPLWIVAHEQTAGRGRRGRDWISAKGNLAASLLVSVPLTPPEAAKLGFVGGLALCHALHECAPHTRIALKWPNDVLANDAKLAGILLESETIDSGLAVVIGFGVNLAHAPVGMTYPATSLADAGCHVTGEAVFARLTDAWVGYDSIWNRGAGFDEIRRLWLARAHGVDAPISVRMGDRVERGMFETLDGDGRLILRRGDGEALAISVGDVYFGDAASVRAAAGAGC